MGTCAKGTGTHSPGSFEGLLWIAFMEKEATNWWNNPDRGKVSQTKIAVTILFADAAPATAGHNNIIQGCDFN